MIGNQENIISSVTVEKSEVLRYLGHNDDLVKQEFKDYMAFFPDIEELITGIIKKDLNLNTVQFENTNLILKSKDISELLRDCDKCVLMCATLGFNIEKNIRRYSYNNLTKGIIIDACATTSIEEVCDLVQDSILDKVAKEEKSLTMRYSPGYGDLDISANRDILNVLDAHRKIGVTVTNTGIMIPRKSVVALIGITNEKIGKVKRTCENCSNRFNCEYRRKADGCGGKTIYTR